MEIRRTNEEQHQNIDMFSFSKNTLSDPSVSEQNRDNNDKSQLNSLAIRT